MKIGVYNEAGELVKLIYAQNLPEPIENVALGGNNTIQSLHGADNAVTIYDGSTPVAVWDGSTQDGGPALNGSYYIKVDNIDPSGVDKSVSQLVTVSRSLLKTSILIYNEAGETVRHLFAVVDDPGPNLALVAQLSTGLLQPGGGTGTPNQLTITLSTGATVIWDGRGDNGTYVLNGQYLIEVHSNNGQGADTTINLKVAVLNPLRDPSSPLQAFPNILNAANGSVVTFQDASGPGLILRVHVFTLAGELVKGWEDTTGNSKTTWNVQDLASGIYLAVVGSFDPQGGLVHQRTLKLAVVH